MTKEQIIQQAKNRAMNKIRKIYHPKYKYSYNQYDERSGAEQIEADIKLTIFELEHEIKNIKKSFKPNKTGEQVPDKTAK